MPEPTNNFTDYKIGIVKKLVEDRGFGFISATKKDTFGDLFFHYKNLRSNEIKEKDIVVFLKIQSKKHTGQEEAIKVAKLNDIIDFIKLVQLFLVYNYTDILNQLNTVSREDLATVNFRGFFDHLLSTRFINKTSSEDALIIKRFIKAIKSCPALDEDVLKSTLRTIVTINHDLVEQLIFDIYIDLAGDEVLAGTNIDVIQAFQKLSDKDKVTVFPKLSVRDRIKVRALKDIDNETSFLKLIDILKADDNGLLPNFQEIEGDLNISQVCIPLLWLNSLSTEFPRQQMASYLRSHYSITTRDNLLAKMTIDEQISIWPYPLIDTEDTYAEFKTFISQAKSKHSAFEAYEISGVKFAPEFYFKAFADGLINPSNANLQLITTQIKLATTFDIYKAMRAAGFEIALIIFKEQLEDRQFESLKVILSNSDFKKDQDSLKLYKLLKLKPATAFHLWEAGLILLPPTSVLATYYLATEDEQIAGRILNSAKTDFKKFFDAAIKIHGMIVHSKNPQYPLRVLNGLKRHLPDYYQEKRPELWLTCNKWTRIYLWLYDHASEFNFNELKFYFILLTPSQQKLFVKKVFWEMKHNYSSIEIDQIIALKELAIDPDLARKAGGQAQILDFSVYVILQAIEDIKNGNITKPETMFDIIAGQIRTPTELLVLEGFFDRCQGRKVIDRDNLSAETNLYGIKADRGSIPNDIIYCEGRKAINKITQEASLCERTGAEFWWCHNNKCYSPCRYLHNDWREYTLLDFLDIANIYFKPSDYEVLLGYINKVNKFLKHMKCASCQHILKPAISDTTQNYGFYRVSFFTCKNENCEELEKQVYLTHCINGHCTCVIDSREVVKCKHKEFPSSNQGWYICKDCLACCNTDKINKRSYILNKTGQSYRGPMIGHRDQQKICCPQCGNEFDEVKGNADDFQRILTWFLKNRFCSSYVLNSGQRKDKKYWFIVQAPAYDAERLKIFKKKLYKYIAAGFDVPDIRENKESYLVAERRDRHSSNGPRLLECTTCDYQLDLTTEYERFQVMAKYHTHLTGLSFNHQ
jgi:cold shock CspA family protein